MEPLIKTVDLKKHFKVNGGLLHAVDGVSISIPRGGTLGVVGESGCGKSTLGRLILRLLPATSGEVYFEDENILNYSKHKLRDLRSQMQIIFQDPYSSLNPRMSVFELIGEPLIMNHACANKKEREKRILELMDTVGLARRFVSTYPHEMDGGRRQRVGVARALALNPKFIVCDEPVSALDVSIQAQILNLLMDLQDEINLTYMFITHDLLVVRHIADEIAVMYLGQCVEKAPAKELFINPCHPYTRSLLAAIPIPKLQDKKEKVLLRGEVSDPINPKPGCRFFSRCVSVRPECQDMDYDLKEISPNHFVSCFLYR